MLILSVTLLTLGLVLYHNFSHSLKRNMDDLLRSKADGIAESIDTYWEAERLETDKNIPANIFNKQNSINFIKIAQRWVNEKTTGPAFINFSVHIFDAYGHPVAFSKDMPVPILSEKTFRDIFQKKSRYEDWKVELTPGKPALMLRTLTMPVIENNRLAYIVQVASPMAPMRTALHNLSLLLILLLPFTVILTGMSGIFLARIGLKLIHLEEALASQRQFMEDISHELKTPLSILKGELEVTLKKVRSAMEYENTLASSLEEVNRLISIVENLLTLAKFDTKTVALQMTVFDLNDLVQSVLDDMRVLARPKQITLDFNHPQALALKADRSQIRRLLLNLLDNAVKYTPQAGKVAVNLWQEDHWIKIMVTDTGVGISAEEHSRIFDRFYRVDKARTDSGFGLGLSIAKSIVKAHHGRIEVKTALHRGSTFTVLFPAS